MAEFAPVLPAKLYPLIDTPSPTALRFVHAPQVVKYKELSSWLEGQPRARIIIDCFAYELDGGRPDVPALERAISLLRGKKLIIVCPDVIRDHRHTMEMLYNYGPDLAESGRLMIVPHGGSLMGWFENCVTMLDAALSMGAPRSLMVGIPRYLSGYGSPDYRHTRGVAASFIGAYYPGIDVHLLGAAKGLNEPVMVAKNNLNVVSMDSTTPFVWTIHHGIYWDSVGKDEMPRDWWLMGPPDDDTAPLNIRTEHLTMAKINIAIWKRALADA